MGDIQDNNYTFVDAEQFSQQLETLKQQTPAILDDFEKYYVFYNMIPTNNEYQQMFENIKKNLDSINTKMFILSNDVESETDKINKKLISLDSLIKKEKVKNKELKIKLGVIQEKETSADIMINNYKEMYDISYLKNWALFLSIIAAGFAISKVSSNKIHV